MPGLFREKFEIGQTLDQRDELVADCVRVALMLKRPQS
jgi:hypothetical protein